MKSLTRTIKKHIPFNKKENRRFYGTWGNGIFEFLDDNEYCFPPFTFSFRIMNMFQKDIEAKIVDPTDTLDPLVWIEDKGMVTLDKYYEIAVTSDVDSDLILIQPIKNDRDSDNNKLGIIVSMRSSGHVLLEEFKEFIGFLLETYPNGFEDETLKSYTDYSWETTINISHGFEFIKSGDYIGSKNNSNFVKFRLKGDLYYQDQYRHLYNLDRLSFNCEPYNMYYGGR